MILKCPSTNCKVARNRQPDDTTQFLIKLTKYITMNKAINQTYRECVKLQYNNNNNNVIIFIRKKIYKDIHYSQINY